MDSSVEYLDELEALFDPVLGRSVLELLPPAVAAVEYAASGAWLTPVLGASAVEYTAAGDVVGLSVKEL